VSAAYLSLLLADGRLPSGAHTQSAGVEPALAAGMTLAVVPDYVRVRLRTVTEVEAATAVLAGRVRKAGGGSASLAEVDAAWRVRTLSDALREASDLLGRSLLRTASAVWDLRDLAAGGPWCRPVVLGATAAAAGLDAEQTARLVGYDDVQTVVSAALKLEPFDPSTGVGWVAGAADEVEAMVARAVTVTRTAEIPAHSAPLVEEWGQRHRTSERRLFRA
jgi:urease accessory protein